MKDKTTITDILVNNFGRDKPLSEIADDFESLELDVANEKSAHGEDTQRMAALKIPHFLPIEEGTGKAGREACKACSAGSVAFESDQIGFVFDLTD